MRRFESNRFVKGPNAAADYAVLSADPRVLEYVENTVFLNTIIEGGGSLKWIAGPTWSQPRYSIAWTLDVNVREHVGHCVGSGYRDGSQRTRGLVYSGLTGMDGTIETLELLECDMYLQSGTWQSDEYGPYTVTASLGGDQNTAAIQRRPARNDQPANWADEGRENIAPVLRCQRVIARSVHATRGQGTAGRRGAARLKASGPSIRRAGVSPIVL